MTIPRRGKEFHEAHWSLAKPLREGCNPSDIDIIDDAHLG